MSEAPQGPGWWYATDGRWYPPPYPHDASGAPATKAIDAMSVSEMPSRPPTPAPDHPPTGMVDGASGFPALETAPVAQRSRSKALWAVSAVAAILAVAVVVLSLALAGRGPANFRTASQQYDLAVSDIVDAEQVNLTFLDTFWQNYGSYVAEWKAASADRRPALTAQFLDDLEAEISQFRSDLHGIDGSLVSRAFDDGTAADHVRDAAVTHYRSWDAWASAVPAEARDWVAAAPSTSFSTWIDSHTPKLGNDIDDSFHRVCDQLSKYEPSDGSYESTIADICGG